MISIVGAGGKTTLMFSLAKELRNAYKVMVCTSTKIAIPKKHQFDFFYIGEGLNNNLENGIHVIGNSISNGKVLPVLESNMLKYKSSFDIILIEADGAKMKSIKGWKEYEPVISDLTSKTIGVLDISNIGKLINEDNIHNIEEFMALTHSKKNEKINMNHMISLINNPLGLFKNSKGHKIIYIPKNDDFLIKEMMKSIDSSIKVVK